MCMCKKPNLNGTIGYSWDGRQEIIHPLGPPLLNEGEIIYDEPGRCGYGVDCHSHHFTLSKSCGNYYLSCMHGSGEDVIFISNPGTLILGNWETMDSDTRYHTFFMIHKVHQEGCRASSAKTRTEWASAFLDNRLKKRKRNLVVSVYIEPVRPTPNE